MSYRNKTYVIFDGGTDLRSYNLMRAWKENEHIDFDFYDAHDINTIGQSALSEEYIKIKLRERMKNAKQAIVLIGEKTKYHTKYVGWEIEYARDLGIPIIAVNLDGIHSCNSSLCHPALKQLPCIVHTAFGPKIVKYALDNVPDWYQKNKGKETSHDWQYNDDIYRNL